MFGASDDVILLGLIIEINLIFSKYIGKLCCNPQYKLHALRQIRKFLTLQKGKLLGNSFIKS